MDQGKKMKLNDKEARLLVELRISGVAHRQAIDQIKQARGGPKGPTPAQEEHRRRAAAALLLSQTTGTTLAEAWDQVMAGKGCTTSEKNPPNKVGKDEKSIGDPA